MNSLILNTLLFILFFQSSDKIATKTGKISFYSYAPIENIKATNNEVKAVIDLSSGEVLFIADIKKFEFKKELMKKHFNNNYLESEKFPHAKFSGMIENIDKIQSEGKFKLPFKGNLIIHGVSKPIADTAYFFIQDEIVNVKAKFKVKTKDFGIKVPRILIKNIAEEIKISVDVNLTPIKQ